MKKSLIFFYFNFILLTNILFSSVVINELMIQPINDLGEQFSEYIELYNTTSEDIDLEGWELSNQAQSIVFQSLNINANSYLVIGMTNNPSLNNGLTFDYEWGIGGEYLFNGSPSIRLYDTEYNQVDIVSIFFLIISNVLLLLCVINVSEE